MGFVKVSLLLFYRRIFITRDFLWKSGILIGLITSFTLAILLVCENHLNERMRLISFLATIFCKWPVYDQWNPEVPYNINVSAFLITNVAGNTLFDLLTLSLPLVALRGLQIDTHRKVMLSIVFSFGSM